MAQPKENNTIYLDIPVRPTEPTFTPQSPAFPTIRTPAPKPESTPPPITPATPKT